MLLVGRVQHCFFEESWPVGVRLFQRLGPMVGLLQLFLKNEQLLYLFDKFSPFFTADDLT